MRHPGFILLEFIGILQLFQSVVYYNKILVENQVYVIEVI